MASEPGWLIARTVLQEVGDEIGVKTDRDALGRVRFLAAGLSHAVYGAAATLADGSVYELVVKLPSRDCAEERDETVRREARLLRYLHSQSLPFRIPRALAEMRVPGGLAAVQEWVPGIPADLRADRFPGGRPWELVARIAAALHGLETRQLQTLVPGYSTRREHVVARMRLLDQSSLPEFTDAGAWIQAHLPADDPSRLLHGDLLGQNLHLSWDDDRPGVVDWGEARLGDPAYDLAIVTRGARRPFGRGDGLHRLVDEYNARAPQSLSVSAVQVHEVLLRCGRYLGVAAEYGAEAPHTESALNAVRSLLGRVSASESVG